MSDELKWEKYRPSNGTEGDIFRADWCDKCAKDANGDCLILARTMAFDVDDEKYPVEWRRRADATHYPDAECTAYEARK